MWTRNRVQAACLSGRLAGAPRARRAAGGRRSTRGIANAATGERGKLDALATAAEAARLLVARRRGGARALDRRDRRSAAARTRSGPRCRKQRRRSLRDGGNDAAEAIMTTDTRTKQAVSAGDGFTVGGMAKGSGMIHPNLATMLAVITTDYPLEPGEAIDVLRPAVDTSFNSISVDGECSTNDAVVLLSSGAATIERTDAADAAFAACPRKPCAPTLPLRSSPTVRVHAGRRDHRSRVRRRRRAGAGNRAADRHLAAREDGALRTRCELGPRADGRGQRAVQRRVRPARPGTCLARLQRHPPFSATAPRWMSEPPVDGTTCTIELDLGLGDARASYLTSDLSYDYVRINADYRS